MVTNMRGLFLCLVGLLFAMQAHGADVTADPMSSVGLSEAIDAAINQLQGTSKWFTNMKTTYSFVNAMYTSTCTPHDTRWSFPSKSSATGMLKRVFDSGVIRVAGVKWANGGIADYVTNPENPTGFWPKYMEEIMRVFNAHYGTNIQISRQYYDNSALVTAKVADGTDDMSEPYYYVAGFLGDVPRIEAFEVSCITAGTTGIFLTKADSGITTMDQLAETIAGSTNKAVGFIGLGNYQSNVDVLGDDAVPLYITDGDTIANQVADGTLIAGYISEGEPADPTRFNLISNGIVSPRAALFRRDQPTCPTATCPPATSTGSCASSGQSSGVVINMFNSGSGQSTC